MVLRHTKGITVALLMLLAACGGDSTGPGDNPGPTFENIAGTYAGVLAGTAQGIALNGTFSITVTQSAGDLSGSYSTTGTLTDGIDTVPFQGSGSLTGTINSGTNPSVNITFRLGECPNYQADTEGLQLYYPCIPPTPSS